MPVEMQNVGPFGPGPEIDRKKTDSIFTLGLRGREQAESAHLGWLRFESQWSPHVIGGGQTCTLPLGPSISSVLIDSPGFSVEFDNSSPKLSG